MEIRFPSALLPTPAAPKGAGDLLAQLQPGQLLDARVESRLAPTAYLLSLGDSGPSVRARSDLDLAPGQRLKLEVIKLGDVPQLRVLPQAIQDDPTSQAIQSAIRSALPRQAGLNELASTLLETLQQPASTLAATSRTDTLTSTLRTLLDSLATRSDLTTPAGLKKAVENSGLFFESRLAAYGRDDQSPAPPIDLKGRLLNLVQQLETRLSVGNPAADSSHTGLAPTAGAEIAGLGGQAASAGKTLATPDASAPSNPPQASASAPGTQGGGSLFSAFRHMLGMTFPTAQPTGQPPADVEGPGSESARPSVPHHTAVDSGELETHGIVRQAAGDTLAIDRKDTPAADATTQTLRSLGTDAPELRNLLLKAEGALARIVLDQLASQPQIDGKQVLWQLQIPYTDGNQAESAKLKILREHIRRDGREQAFWSVVLELNPPGLGTVHSRISLTGGQIDSYFWSDRPATARLIDAHLDVLAARLQQAGLAIGQLDTLPGAPADIHASAPIPPAGLLSERA
ncbi:flagellar hook-length control protein FliK [Methylococcus sp. EFPC2]|uniref:flagellar hook-length control protein FliK n=1 Tax=Methylococcus sp. EFPC2 TaxID=2812648 RepID=UPI00196756E7|nr:flagellar hook-length control protein FliK [Methylococcus sp. EFPC2]QSA98833.1 flagellar hook-length control protein FliK [Methylococcus sp. EFPC2]